MACPFRQGPNEQSEWWDLTVKVSHHTNTSIIDVRSMSVGDFAHVLASIDRVFSTPENEE